MNEAQSYNLRVNIGCGQSPCTGWLNFDSSPSTFIARIPLITPASQVLVKLNLLTDRQVSFIRFCKDHRIHFGDAIKGLPLPDDSCSIVYASHVLEHLYRLDEAPRFLRECKRLLRSGGTLRLAVPDLRVYISRYEQTNNAESFAKDLHMCPPKRLSRWISIITGDRTLHRWIYDHHSLSGLLQAEGFVRISLLKAGETSLSPAPKGLNLRERAWESLYIEAAKP